MAAGSLPPAPDARHLSCIGGQVDALPLANALGVDRLAVPLTAGFALLLTVAWLVLLALLLEPVL
jgi:hypothetical protein